MRTSTDRRKPSIPRCTIPETLTVHFESSPWAQGAKVTIKECTARHAESWSVPVEPTTHPRGPIRTPPRLPAGTNKRPFKGARIPSPKQHTSTEEALLIMTISSRRLAVLYRSSQDQMRNIDGLQPQEAFDELLKYLFLKESTDEAHHQFPTFSPPSLNHDIVSSNIGLVKNLRNQLKMLLKETDSWSRELWQDQEFHLSDTALLSLHELFEHVDFSTIDVDTRSGALSEFIPGELRKGLGIFPTPDSIARMMVEIASPNEPSLVLDPACGTGTFLVEIVRRWSDNCHPNMVPRVWGIDKSARMLLLSELNLGQNKKIKYRKALADSLYQSPSTLFGEAKEGFDYILTNPPFGMVVDRNKHDMTAFQTCRDHKGVIVKRQQSEVVFTEQCMKYLKPGGLLGIVLPRSVVTNSSLAAARLALNELGYLESIVNLPPETFCISGTQTNTVVLFLRRYRSISEKTEPVVVVSADINNVGFDSTGRPRKGSQLEGIPKALRAAIKEEVTDKSVRLLTEVPKGHSITRLPDLLYGRVATSDREDLMPMSDLVEFMSNGKTLGRTNYSSKGLFLVKVGNLTGRGINWEARDRNFTSGNEEIQRRKNLPLMLVRGDILLTSSAHSPVYIAKKVDIVDTIPEWVGGEASFVGEVMKIRVKEGIDPFILLAYLRLPSTQRQIQSMVRGQTAHLHPKDLLEMQLPRALIGPPVILQSLADKVREETKLSEKMNHLAFEQREAYPMVENVLAN